MAIAATYTWVGGTSGDWDTPSNWNSDIVPSATVQADISGTPTSPIFVTVGTVDTNDLVGVISLLDATLEITGGSLSVGTIVTAYDTLLGNVDVLSISAGSLTIQQGSSIGDFSNGHVGGLFEKSGTVDFQNGESKNQPSYVDGGQSGIIQSGGTLQVDQGSLTIDGNSTFMGTLRGPTSGGPGGTIDFDGDNSTAYVSYKLLPGVVIDPSLAALSVTNEAQLQVDTDVSFGGVFTEDSISSVLIQAGNTLTLSDMSDTLSGQVIGAGGTLKNTGVIQLLAVGQQHPLIGGQVLFENAGTLLVPGSIIDLGGSLSDTAVLRNDSGSTLMLANGVAIQNSAYTNAPDIGDAKILNGGSVAFYEGTGTVNIYVDYTNEATGTIDFNPGDVLYLRGGGQLGGAVNGYGILELGDSQDYHLESGLNVSASSTISVGADGSATPLFVDADVTDDGGFFLNNSGTLQFPAGSTLTLTNHNNTIEGDVTGPGTLLISGAEADLVIGGGVSLAVSGTIEIGNSATVSQEYFGWTIDNSTLKIDAGGTYEYRDLQENGAHIYEIGNSAIDNAGTFEAGLGAGYLVVAPDFTNSGLVSVTSSGLQFTTSFTNAFGAEVSVSNFGSDLQFGSPGITNDGSIAVTNRATIEFGNVFADTGDIGSIAIGSSAIITFSGAVDPQTVTFDDATGRVDLAYSSITASVFQVTFDGFQAVGGNSDIIDVENVGLLTKQSFARGVLTMTGSGEPTVELTFAGNYTLSSFKLSSDNNNGTLIEAAQGVVCFLAGTLIATQGREVPVETLVAGDQVLTLRGQARRIVWIGRGHVLATRGRRNAATPVIVRKGALADNVPHHDFRITKAHSLYIDDVLIPVEFLVNHRSIAWDDRAQEVSIYHIELETHDVLIANGAPAESYRDDGNRWLFQNANGGWDLPPQEPCAPVLTGGAIVDAIWRRLLDRAGPRPGVPLTDDPDLHVLMDGQRLDITERVGEAYVCYLPAVPSVLCIVSRAAAPAELGLARDPRVLGVALRRVVVRKGTRFRVAEANDERLTEGFHAFEADKGFRWTDGDAAIPAELFTGFTGPLELVLHVGATARYLADKPVQRAA